ncbi:MAG: hypothetical protein H6508_06860 [Calditrichaeota bacterium]|nr:hypothetical protein [Calditrichota bacterium]
MKFIRWTAVMMAALAMLLSGVGCDNKSTGTTPTVGNIGSIQIVLGTPNDTLRFVPGDSASTTVTVIVSDDQGRAMRGQKVDISLSNNNLGVIEWADENLEDTTNAQGRVNAIFRTYQVAGNQIISATAGTLTDNAVLTILPASNSVCDLRMTIADTLLEANQYVEDSTRIVLTLTDCEGKGIRDVALNIRANGGRLIEPALTDSGGRTTTYWYNNGQFGTFQVSCDIADFHVQQDLYVQEIESRPGYLTVTSNKLMVEADGCVTAANVTAVLQNQFGEAIRNDTVRFGAPHGGAIQPYGITDSLGRAFATFCGMGIPNGEDPTDSAYVVARYQTWSLRDTVHIRINPASAISNVTLSATTASGIAGKDSIQLFVSAAYENGSPVNGYYAHFNFTQCGDFLFDSVRLVNGTLDTNQFYKLCQNIPPTAPELTVTVGGVTSDPLLVQINPGAATFVTVDPLPILTTNESIPVYAQVVDTFFNPVRSGTVVIFTSSIGTVSPSTAATNIDGIATTNLSTGTTAGDGVVRASLGNGQIDSTALFVQSGDASSLSMTLMPPSLLVRGSGGQDWSQIRANAVDANGNPVPNGTWVYFELLGAVPTGANINNHGLVDSAQTSNGLAVATLNAGTGVGPIYVQGCVNTEIGLQCAPATGTVVAGPPAEIQIGVDEVGEDAGGAAWDLEISALIKDAVQNNVIAGTAVFFSVVPEEYAQILSQSVVVGNENADGDVRPGVAFTTLRFTSLTTNRLVQIVASTANGITETMDFILPIQEPSIELYAEPSSWHFGIADPCRIALRAIVRDGHEVRINNQEVYYRAARGRMYTNQQGTGQAISLSVTGPEYNPVFLDGECTLWLVEDVDFIFPDPLTPEIPGEVGVEVVGFQDAQDSQVINFRR